MSAPASSPLIGAPGSVPRIVVEGLMHRGELAALELREARTYAASTAVAAAAAAALALLGGFAGTFAIAAAVWERPDRGLIMGLVTLAYFIGAAALAWWVAARLKTWRPLAETLYQFREDCACIHQHLSENSR
jgi:uncharacterized membrane protein YqjE